MDRYHELEAMVARNLVLRGLTRVGERLAFVHRGQTIELAVEQSVYSGYFVVVRDGHRNAGRFRARAGEYDWNALAALIVEIAGRRAGTASAMARASSVKEGNQRLALDLASIVNAGPRAPIAIEPSVRAPGRVRVSLPEVELDPVSVMRLFEIVRDALPASPRGSKEAAVSVL